LHSFNETLYSPAFQRKRPAGPGQAPALISWPAPAPAVHEFIFRSAARNCTPGDPDPGTRCTNLLSRIFLHLAKTTSWPQVKKHNKRSTVCPDASSCKHFYDCIQSFLIYQRWKEYAVFRMVHCASLLQVVEKWIIVITRQYRKRSCQRCVSLLYCYRCTRITNQLLFFCAAFLISFPG